MPGELPLEVSIANVIYSIEPGNDFCSPGRFHGITAPKRVWVCDSRSAEDYSITVDADN